MKFNYILLLLLFTFFNCKKETKEPYTPTNYLADFQTEKPQLFDLDTLEYKQVIGKHGTKINFNRHLFNVKVGAKIQLKLIELYDFKEILYRNIQTLTTDNQLLETSGVLKITFTSNGKEIQLKENEKLTLFPPKEKLKNNDIFLSKTDSLGRVKWNITNQKFINFKVNIGGGISKTIIIPEDSLSFYSKREEKNERERKQLIRNYDSIVKRGKDFIVLSNLMNWINIDKLVKTSPTININIDRNINDFWGINCYITYDGIYSFTSSPIVGDDSILSNIPIVGKTNLIVIGERNNEIYYDEILISELKNNSTIKLDMKKIKKEKLKELFE